MDSNNTERGLSEDDIKDLAKKANMSEQALSEALNVKPEEGSDKFTVPFVMGHSKTKSPIRRFRGSKNN